MVPRILTIYVPEKLDIDSILDSARKILAEKHGVKLQKSRTALVLMVIGYHALTRDSIELEFMKKPKMNIRVGCK